MGPSLSLWARGLGVAPHTRPAALPAARARRMAGATTRAPRKYGPLTLMVEKTNAAPDGPAKRAKAPQALLRPMIWPWLCSSIDRDISAPALGKATDEQSDISAIRA